VYLNEINVNMLCDTDVTEMDALARDLLMCIHISFSYYFCY